jgi:hypothetical protein
MLAVGVFAAALLAILVGYHVQPGKGPLLTPRGHEKWMSVSRVLVTQQGFPEGRATLPPTATNTNPAPGAGTSEGLQFADPGRFQGLASLYAVLVRSDQVLSRVVPRPSPEQVTAVTVDSGVPNSQATLPVLEILATAGGAVAARKLNSDVVGALRGTLADQQNANGIPAASRVRLDSLEDPGPPQLVSGRSHIASVVVFVLVLMATIFLAKLLERVRGAAATMRRPRIEDPQAPPATRPEPHADQALNDWRRAERPAGAAPDEVAAGGPLPQP